MAGTAVGFGAGMLATSLAANATTTVAAPGIAGWFGATSTVATFATAEVATIGVALAFPVALGVGFVYVVSQFGSHERKEQ